MFVRLLQSVEAAVLLPEKGDFSQVGVKKQGLHLVTAGSKGECPGMLPPGLEAEENETLDAALPLLLGCVFFVWQKVWAELLRAGAFSWVPLT